MSEFGSNQEFHPGEVISKHYNYVVDYFELRAQRGQDGLLLPADEYWFRDDVNGYLYPIYLDDTVVINGQAPLGSEKLRVVGSINATRLTMADSYIYDNGGELTFYDTSWGEEVTLSSLMQGYFTRDAVNGWLYPTNVTDNILLGLSSGTALRRIDLKTEANDGSSYVVYAVDSSDIPIFSVSDQGLVNMGEVLTMDTHTIDVTGDYMVLDGHIYINHVSGSLSDNSTWQINNTNPYYSRNSHSGDGIGFPGNEQVGVWLNNNLTYIFSETSFSIPQEAWITAGVNMIRVNDVGDIELGTFIFGEELITFNDADGTYIYNDDVGNLVFADKILGVEVTLSGLLSTNEIYWSRDEITNTITPKFSGDSLNVPSLAGATNLSLYITPAGDIFSGSFIQYWTRNSTYSLVSLSEASDTVVIGKDDYDQPSAYKFEVWGDNTAMYMGVGHSIVEINIPTYINDVLDVDDGTTGQSSFGTGLIVNASYGNLAINDFIVRTDTLTAIHVDAASNAIGFFSAIPSVQSTGWTMTNDVLTKILDADATTINELADLLASLANELKTKGILGG